MIREEAKNQVGKGWSQLIDLYYDMTNRISVDTTITYVGNRIGMLDIKAEPDNLDDTVVQDILDRLSWSIERDSAKVCEICGEKGFRRKLIPNSPNRCNIHYAELMNELAEQE